MHFEQSTSASVLAQKVRLLSPAPVPLTLWRRPNASAIIRECFGPLTEFHSTPCLEQNTTEYLSAQVITIRLSLDLISCVNQYGRMQRIIAILNVPGILAREDQKI
ncbi:hypothetical protein VNO77_23165 [Canavalia gladiata]|uniref:Uncharacterized protein n=1 Tax=Canavalia gladiata TaxID=3824 RepID=A0AAN9L3Y7_CANGL